MTDAAGLHPTTMNNARRKMLTDAVDLIDRAKALLDVVRDEEETAMLNLPEAIQASSRGDAMEETVSAIDEKIDELDSMRADLVILSSRDA